MPNEKFLKITYHGAGLKKLNAYLKMPSPNFFVLKEEISLCLFDQHKQPRTELRIYWIDEDNDEIEIVNQCDYEVFTVKRSERQHLQVAPIIPAPEKTAETLDPSFLSIHDHVECDGCDVNPIIGFRYKCIQCPNYDLCQKCEAKHIHAEHMLVRMPNPHCPSIIDAYVTGHGNRRLSKRAKGVCPLVSVKPIPSCGMSPAAANAEASQNSERLNHYVRKQQRRQMRNGVFSHLYDIMQDLAEGGATAPNEESPATDKAAATEQPDKAAAEKSTTEKADGTTEKPAAETTDAADAAHVIKDPIAAAVSNIEACVQASVTSARNAAAAAQTAAAFAGALPKTPPSTPNDAENSTKNDNTVPVAPSFENLAQFLDPQFMKTGVQILNNFSEMFAKMLDPADGGAAREPTCPFQNSFPKRKESSASTAESSVSSSTASKATSINDFIGATVQQESTTPGNTSPMGDASQTPASRRSQSEDLMDWQLIDKQTSSPPNATTATTSANEASTEINYVQLSKDLKAHVDAEQKRDEQAKKQDTPIAKEAVDSTAEASVLTAIPIERPASVSTPAETAGPVPTARTLPESPRNSFQMNAVPVFHSDQRINNAVLAMMAMGFSNEGAWLTQLLESVNGNIPEALDLMTAAQRNK